MAASVDMKIRILKKSMSTFSNWLDGCDQLISELPQKLEKSDSTHLRELALKYKVRVNVVYGKGFLELWTIIFSVLNLSDRFFCVCIS